MRLVGAVALACGLYSGLVAAAGIDPSFASNLAVYRVRAIDQRATVVHGSAVLVAPGKLLTACHVLRSAREVEVAKGGAKWLAQPYYLDNDHDLCVLSSPSLTGKTANLASDRGLVVGQPIFAVGYPRGGALAVSEGQVTALHPLDGGHVIQGSAVFDYGQSGGGLFDREGQLIGIIAFKALAGGGYHFALPVGWIDPQLFASEEVATPLVRGAHSVSFWERSVHLRPYFLRAVSLEANRDWKALSEVCQQWVSTETENPESWFALHRAFLHLKRERDAEAALHRALRLKRSRP